MDWNQSMARTSREPVGEGLGVLFAHTLYDNTLRRTGPNQIHGMAVSYSML